MQYILIPLLCAGLVYAQAPPKFDAASLKVDPRGIRVGPNVAMQGGPGTKDPGLFRISYGQPLKAIISKAWNIPADEIFGPASLGDGFYTINATMPLETTKEQFLLMLQGLLTERFHLALHREAKDFPAYSLVLASDKPDTKKLKEWKPDPNAVDPPATSGRAPTDEQGFPLLGQSQPAGMSIIRHEGSPLMTIFETHHQSMADFAQGLGLTLKRTGITGPNGALVRVVDNTGLAGVWQFRFRYEGTMAAAAPSPSPGDVSTDTLSLFTELENQTGLKLVKAKGVPVNVLVIDHADKTPVEN